MSVREKYDAEYYILDGYLLAGALFITKNINKIAIGISRYKKGDGVAISAPSSYSAL